MLYCVHVKANAVSVATVVLAQAENRQWPAALQQLLGFDDRGSAKRKALGSAPFGSFPRFLEALCCASHPITLSLQLESAPKMQV